MGIYMLGDVDFTEHLAQASNKAFMFLQSFPFFLTPKLQVIIQNKYFAREGREKREREARGEKGRVKNKIFLSPLSYLFIKKVLKIRGGSFHTAVITKSGKLYMFGRNTVGQLGNTLFPFSPSLSLLSFLKAWEILCREILLQNYPFLLVKLPLQKSHLLFLL
jgi:hypothetical protein